MKSRFLIILLMLSALCAAANDRKEPFTAREAFGSMPYNVRNYLSEQNADEMLIYFDEGTESPVTNDFGSACSITELSPCKITFTQGDDIVTTIFVLNPKSDYPVIGVIQTLSTPVPESSLHFYTHNWQPADNIVAVTPGIADWTTSQGRSHIDDIAREIPFILASYDYNPDTRILTVANGMYDYYRADDAPQALSYLKPALRYKWTGTKFKPVK